MSFPSPQHFHLAFGRVVHSDVEMPLLPQATQNPIDNVAATIHVDENPVDPGVQKIGGDDATTMTMFRQGDDNLLCLNTTGWVAVLQEGQSQVILRPDARRMSDGVWRESLQSRVLGDRLVTAVIPYLPSVWGSIAVHGSLLTKQGDSILLLGESGFGKSTISQYLQLHHGWHVLDDDTSLLSMEGDSALTPMGAQSRVRRDAADYLGLPGISLPGYGGHKSALERVKGGLAWNTSYPLRAIIQLSPFGTKHGSEAGRLILDRVATDRALGLVFESLFSLSPDRHEAVQRQFAVAARWAASPFFSLSYDKSQHDASTTANELATRLTGGRHILPIRSASGHGRWDPLRNDR